MIGQLIAAIGLGLLFIFLGYLVKNRKKYNLIAGYNTLSEDEKAKVDIVGLAKLIKNILVAMGLAIILISIIDYVTEPKMYAAEITGIIILAGTFILLATSRNYKRS